MINGLPPAPSQGGGARHCEGEARSNPPKENGERGKGERKGRGDDVVAGFKAALDVMMNSKNFLLFSKYFLTFDPIF